MTIRAAFFDVGDTLVEHWAPRDRLDELLRVALRREFGEQRWHDAFLGARLGPAAVVDALGPDVPLVDDGILRQETLRWYAEWFRNADVGTDDVDLERLRVTMTVPLDLVSTPVPGAFPALRWCKARGLVVGLITNTLSRGDAEVWEDWRRFGLADAIDHVVSSHSAGWQKPHRAIFERALSLAGVRADEALMVGDRLDADIFGASRLGMRTVLRRTPGAQPAVDVRPDAVIDDLTRLPAVVEPWLQVPPAQT